MTNNDYQYPPASKGQNSASPESQPIQAPIQPLEQLSTLQPAQQFAQQVELQATQPESPLAFEIRGVSRSFGAVRAVQNLSFQGSSGKVIALVGANGCGKSTLMLMLAGLLAPDQGEIMVGGINPVQNPAAVHSLVGWMPDQLGAWENLKVREVLETVGQAHFMQSHLIPNRVNQLLEQLDLVPLANQPAQVLSRGQKQRLGVARALMHNPRILILDEPASGLDPAARRNLFNLVREFAAKGGTVLISSHILSELEEMADEVIVMDAGQIVHAEDAAKLDGKATLWKLTGADEPALVAAIQKSRFALQSFTPAATATGGRPQAFFKLQSQGEAEALLQEMVQAGARVISFAPAAGALESMYLSLDAAKREGSK